MLTKLTTPQYQDLKAKILSQRNHMIGITSSDHWLKLPTTVKTTLAESFNQLTSKEISGIIGFSEETVQNWQLEWKVIEELKTRVQKCKVGRKNLAHTSDVRGDVCALTRLGTVNAVSESIGISRPTIIRWMKQERNANLGDSAELISTIDDLECAQLADNAEAKQLTIFLERHKGKIRKKYSLAEKKLILSLAERFGSKLVHETYKVSYDTIARLKRREETELDRKKRVPLRYIPVVEMMKKHPGMGPMQIRDYIHRHLGLSMGVNSIRKIMEQNGWVPPFVKVTRVDTGMRLFEAARKNYMWHMDFKHQYINKSKVYILFIQDDFSRFIVGYGVADGEKLDAVLIAVEEGIRIHGKPEVIMSDGGSAFFSWRGTSRFTRFLEDFGIEQFVAQTPNVNGKLENLNQQVEKELLLVTSFASLDHFHRELAQWVGFYNFSRLHQGLGSRQVPADRYFPGAKQWYGEASDVTKQQSLIAETMATLLSELKKPK